MQTLYESLTDTGGKMSTNTDGTGWQSQPAPPFPMGLRPSASYPVLLQFVWQNVCVVASVCGRRDATTGT
jgi:hypothetical protein